MGGREEQKSLEESEQLKTVQNVEHYQENEERMLREQGPRSGTVNNYADNGLYDLFLNRPESHRDGQRLEQYLYLMRDDSQYLQSTGK